MKSFRINQVPFGAPERLAALIDAKGLSSAAKKFQRGGGLRLSDGTYYLFEEGRYENGLSITLPAGWENNRMMEESNYVESHCYDGAAHEGP